MRKKILHVPAFDTFPFLGILASTLGSLLLIVISIVALSVGPGATEIWAVEGDAGNTPVVVEWDGAFVTIHPEKVQVSGGSCLG